ncbi:glycerate kinase [soil metagenome]
MLLAAPDKFRGSLSAPEVVAAVGAAARGSGWRCTGAPMADGGEGMLDAFGGADRASQVTGPLGAPVAAAWRLGDGSVAVIESAVASGLLLAGGAEGNDPMAATSAGTGELIAEAVLAGARRVVVGLGGSAMTDGGLGALDAVLDRLDGDRPVDRGVELLVACDVQTPFTEAARVFGPQKGADPHQVEQLTRRLEALKDDYARRFDVDLSVLPGGGAAGGLGGGLVVLGAHLVPGLDLVAEQVDLAGRMAGADLVVTGEGALDAESFNGKVVGGVVQLARERGIPVLVVAGIVRPNAPANQLTDLSVVDLTRTYGLRASWDRTAECIERAVHSHLTDR